MTKSIQEQWATLKAIGHTNKAALNWGMLIIGLLLVILWVVLPYLDWRNNQQALIQKNIQQVARLQGLKGSIKQWQTAETQIQAQLEQQLPRFFNAPSYAQAQQAMYTEITGLLKQNHLRLISQSLVESAIVEFGEQISLELNIQGDLADIINFIDGITTHPKLLVFKRLYIAKDSQNGLLQANIAGYRLTVKTP